MKKIYIFHEYGEHLHYQGLEYYCKKNNIKFYYREFSLIKNIYNSLKKINIKAILKQFINLFFFIELLIIKDKVIVLGIAPYDFKLFFLQIFLKNHNIIYHTSWTCWDGSFYPKKLFVNQKLISFWKHYIKNQIKKICVVSQAAKNELKKNLNIKNSKLIVVNHSFNNSIFYYLPRDINLSFIYVGRLENFKGVLDILKFFSNKKNCSLTIVGDGSLKNEVCNYSKKFNNIQYLGYIKDKIKLSQIYNRASFLVLNSKKTKFWEELFGMVIVEAMSCGVIPITTDHKGPLEIISNTIDGFVFSEREYVMGLNSVVNMVNSKNNKLNYIKENAIKTAQKYSVVNISEKWGKCFE